MAAVARIDVDTAQSLSNAKEFGAFYTDAQIAQFLVRWALRSSEDTLMDPSFGGGVFLRSACEQVLRMGGTPSDQVFGVELDSEVHSRTADRLLTDFGVPCGNLLLSDFFSLMVTPTRLVDVVVGNPPFIRYHRFVGEARKRALAQAASHGVQLKELSSSWAPFLVHSVAMLKLGGRLAMVVPAEIAHAAYALPVLRYLAASFREVRFLAFRKKLFPDLSEDTLLLLAEDKGSHQAGFVIHEYAHAGMLDAVQHDQLSVSGTPVDTRAISTGKERLIEYLLPRETRELYQRLRVSKEVSILGRLADVGIGYVTGANDFFHLTPEQVRVGRIPNAFLLPTVRRGRSVSGLRFTLADWCRTLDAGEGSYLLHIPPDAELPDAVRAYIKTGEHQGIANAYKCRTRKPWYSVPHVYRPDAFLSYMSGNMPYLVANDAGVVTSNSLHVVRLHGQSLVDRDALAALWHTSLTQLSTEIEGHALGGGMLKLEPTEAENLLIALPQGSDKVHSGMIDRLDALLRTGQQAEVQSIADDLFLRSGLGLDKSDCDLLRDAVNLLRHRRQNRRYAA